MSETNQTRRDGPVSSDFVSVVIPSRNRRRELKRCLDALADQTHTNREIIVVDDGSDDGTPEFIQSYAAGHPTLPLRCLVNPTNIGANASRNRGIREARGLFVAFLDSDCLARHDWLEQLIKGFTNPRVAAVTGIVDNPPPRNIYELAYRGTSRVGGSSNANRLVAGNMALRRDVLLNYPLEEDLKYGCDEEGIYLRLRAAGYQQKLVPDARVLHEHPFSRKSFFRQARLGGAAAAWLVYKYHLWPRLDLLPFMLSYATLPLLFYHRWLGVVPAFFLVGAILGLAYNEYVRKGKTLAETAKVFPILFVYYQVRLFGYVVKAISLRLSSHHVQRHRLSPR